ncbi:MAG: hypothetical protein ACFFC6_07055 [Promethearchaeota archaeon]
MVLLYQTLDFYNSCYYCRGYRQIFGIPISLLGIGFICLVFSEVVLIGVLPTPVSPIKRFPITLTTLKRLYWLLALQLVLAFLAVLVLLSIEIFLIGICQLCTVSQVIIVINNVLVFSWNPFELK